MDLAYKVVNGNVICNDVGDVEKRLLSQISKGKTLHFSLIDPEKQYSRLSLDEIITNLYSYGTDVLLIGGSTGVLPEKITEINEIKESNNIKIPTIIFPRSIGDLSGRADAVLYMHCPNSRKRKYVVDEGVEGAPYLLKGNLEAIPVTYLIIEPGEAVGFIADAQLIPRDKPEIAISYASAAKANGCRWLYAECGSNANPPIHEQGGPELISAIVEAVNLPLLVGGGLRTPDAVRIVKKAGAHGVVTGNIIEKEDMGLMKRIIEAMHES